MKQFSVFLPNKVGAMLEVVKLLSVQNTHVVALSVSESTDSAIARIIASDPERVEKLFREKNVPFGVSQVVVVEMREVATQLVKLLAALVMAEVNVHFAYPLLIRPRGFAAIALHVDDTECASSVLMGEGYPLLIRPRGFAAIALHVDDTECASSVLMGEGFKLLSQDDITR